MKVKYYVLDDRIVSVVLTIDPRDMDKLWHEKALGTHMPDLKKRPIVPGFAVCLLNDQDAQRLFDAYEEDDDWDQVLTYEQEVTWTSPEKEPG